MGDIWIVFVVLNFIVKLIIAFDSARCVKINFYYFCTINIVRTTKNEINIMYLQNYFN